MNNRRHTLPKLELESLISPLYAPVYLKSCCYFGLSLTVVNLTRFPVDTILEILPGESYNGIRALVDLSMCVKYTNKLSGTVAGETVTELTSNLA